MTQTRRQQTPGKRRLLRPCLQIGMVVVLILLGVWAIFHWYAGATLADAVKRVDAAEARWRLEDLEADRAQVPHDQNGALLVLQAAGKLPERWSAKLENGEKVRRVRPVERLTPEQTALLCEVLTPVEPALVDARLLVTRSTGRFSLTYTPDWASTLIDHQNTLYEIGGLLGYDIELRAENLDLDGALGSCRAQVNAGRAVGDEPIYGNQRFRIASGVQAVGLAEMVLGQGVASEDALAALQHLLEEEERHPGLEIGLRGEQAGFHQWLEFVESGQAVPKQYTGYKPTITILDHAGAIVERDVLKLHHARFLDDIASGIQQAKVPWEQRAGPFTWPGLGGMCGNSSIPEVLRITCTQPDPSFHLAHARIRCGIAMLAAERFRLAHGRWPKSTAELAPEVLKQPPVDAYLGGPIGLRATDDGIIIYSKGPNGSDDGGDIGEQFSNESPDIGYRLWDVAARRQSPTPVEKPAN